MSGQLNGPVEMKCECGNDLPKDKDHAIEHPEECCDCFDEGFGKKPKITIDRKTQVDLFNHEEYD